MLLLGTQQRPGVLSEMAYAQKSSPQDAERAPAAASFQTALATRTLNVFLQVSQFPDVIFKSSVTSMGIKFSRLGQIVSNSTMSQCYYTAAYL